MTPRLTLNANSAPAHYLRFPSAFLGAVFVALCLSPSLSGCGGPSRDVSMPTRASDEGLPAEALAVRKAFESASPSKKGPVEEALSLIKSGSRNPAAYRESIPMLQKLAANPTLSPDQRKALETLIEKLSTGLKTAAAH